MLRSAVERQLTILGEAIVQLARIDSVTAEEIRDFRRIISFRNRVIHLYEDIDEMLVWNILKDDVPLLKEDVQRLLENSA